MSETRTHYVTTADGVAIGGTVHGQGPPLVLLQGVIGDGDLDWQALVPHLAGRFTCHTPSLRGRGLSGDHPDLSLDRLVDDVLAYLDSLEEPAGLAGWSLGADMALATAGAQPDAVAAVAPVEPVMPRLMDEQERAALGAAVARMGELYAEGRLAEAARAFAGFPFNDEDIAVAQNTNYFEAAGRYVPNMLSHFQQQKEYQGTTPDAASVLGTISAPVLVVLGSHTKPYAIRAARRVTDHAPDAQIHEIPGAGHAEPLTHPEALAEALAEFHSPARHPV